MTRQVRIVLKTLLSVVLPLVTIDTPASRAAASQMAIALMTVRQRKLMASSWHAAPPAGMPSARSPPSRLGR